MAISQTEYGWFSSLTGRTESSKEAAEHYETKELAKRQSLRWQEAEASLNRLSTEEVRHLAECTQILADESQGLDSAAQSTVVVWMASRPEYKNDDHNRRLIEYHMRKIGQWPPLGTTTLDSVFVELSNAGLLHLNQSVLDDRYVAEQKKQAAELGRRRELSEEELEAMPLPELERLCKGYL